MATKDKPKKKARPFTIISKPVYDSNGNVITIKTKK